MRKCWLPAFSPFLIMFSKDSFFWVVKSRDCVVKANSSPNNKNLDWSKLKVFADNKINVTEKSKFVLGRIENIVGKGENAGYQHFLLFPQCFQKVSCFKVVKSRDCAVKN